MSEQQQQPPATGPPYGSTVAVSGGVPTIIPDVPVSAVLMLLFICFAATNMTILQRNRRRGHKFLISGVLFGFSMARITTLVLRIAWATRPANVRLALAATILVNAGVLLLYIVNLLFAQRILRARQPPLGWHFALRAAFRAAYACIAGALAMVIVGVVLSAYTLDPRVRRACRDLTLAASTWFLVVAAAPLAVLAPAILLPRHAEAETFGRGRAGGGGGSPRSQALVVGSAGLLCTLLAGFKAGTAWMPPAPAGDLPWYFRRPAFYVFVFGLEIVTLGLFTVSRVDRRFHVPDGSKGPGDYSAGNQESSDGGFGGKNEANASSG